MPLCTKGNSVQAGFDGVGDVEDLLVVRLDLTGGVLGDLRDDVAASVDQTYVRCHLHRGWTATLAHHLAWEVDTLTELQRIQAVLIDNHALVGASDHHTTKALYAHDPVGVSRPV